MMELEEERDAYLLMEMEVGDLDFSELLGLNDFRYCNASDGRRDLRQ